MSSPRGPVRPWWLLGVLLTPACLLTTSLSELSSGAASGDDAGDGAARDSAPTDAAVDNLAADGEYSSCAAAKLLVPGARSGVYSIAATGGGASFRAYCDMVDDEGGWMLITPELAEMEAKRDVTVTRSTDAKGGLVERVYANHYGCSDDPTAGRSSHVLFLSDRPKWTKVRMREVFAGSATCWSIFGADDTKKAANANLVPFEKSVDSAREGVRMGGKAGNAFDGNPRRCVDTANENFWHRDAGEMERSGLVILRRAAVDGPAGLTTTASCTTFGPGATSPTYWEYRDIYVR